jgi:DNA-binding NarL/FixJ family response regulator
MNHRDVLVVDDDAATRALLEVLLSRAGLTVRTVCDGDEAVQALNDYAVDAIVLSAAPDALLGETRRKYPIWCAMRKPADINDLMENVFDCMLQPPVSPAARPSA